VDDGVAGLGMAPGEQHHGPGQDNVVAGSGTMPVWSMMSPAWVREDGGA
jgi:hypothetical protein